MPWPHALNKNVFNKRLNCSGLRHCLRFIGSEFHSRGPTAAKHRSPKMLDVRRVTQVADSDSGRMSCVVGAFVAAECKVTDSEAVADSSSVTCDPQSLAEGELSTLC